MIMQRTSFVKSVRKNRKTAVQKCLTPSVETMAILHRTTYIVLRHTPFQESSLIISGIAPDLGRLDFVVKGALGTGKKKFPQIGLFRELGVEFRMPEAKSSLMALRHVELLTNFDSLALHTENYLAACEFAKFLLANVKPMLDSEQSYAALKVMLGHFCASGRPEPWLTLARLAFLNESGLIPEPEGAEFELLNALISASQGVGEMPELSETYFLQVSGWVKKLLRHHGFH